MTRRHRPLRLLVVAGLAAAGLLTLPSSSFADEDKGGRFPGLPFMACPDDPPPSDSDPCLGSEDGLDLYSWINAVSVGMAGSTVAKQWTRIPLAVMGNNVVIGNRSLPDSAIANDYLIRTFFVAPEGSDHNYGISPRIPVRTVAFGSIPVEATLEFRQRRDGNDLPVPLELRYRDEALVPVPGGTRTTAYAAQLDDVVEVRITDLTVDGVDVGLSGTCTTGPAAQLDLTSDELNVVTADGEETGPLGKLFDEFDPAKGFYGFYGGTVHGALDIPAFSGCTTRTNDDLSPLLTSALSSKDNPVAIRVGSLNCVEFNPDDGSLLPPKPGTNTPAEAGCSQEYYETDPVTNPRVRTVPFPLDIPGYAPGEQPPE